MGGQPPVVYVDGVPLTALAYWGDLEVRDRFPYGSWEISWAMPLDPWKRYSQVRDEKPVEVRIGPHIRSAGNLSDIDWDTGRMVAVGAIRQGEGALCFAADGTTTSTPDTAIDEAISRGALDWIRPASISAVPFAEDDATDSLNYVTALLDAYSTSVNKRIVVDAQRRVSLASDPTEPTAMIINDSGVLGVSDEKKAGTVFGRYVDSTTLVRATASYGDDLPEVGVDWTGLGPIDSTKAQGLCQGIWSQLQAQAGWTNGITVHTGQLRSMGDQALHLGMFKAGEMVRLLGVRDERGLSANTDVIIDESIWTPGEDTLQLNPVGMAARDIRSIVEGTGGVLL